MYTILHPHLTAKLREPRVVAAADDRAVRPLETGVGSAATSAPALTRRARPVEHPGRTAGLAWPARLRQALWPSGSRGQ